MGLKDKFAFNRNAQLRSRWLAHACGLGLLILVTSQLGSLILQFRYVPADVYDAAPIAFLSVRPLLILGLALFWWAVVWTFFRRERQWYQLQGPIEFSDAALIFGQVIIPRSEILKINVDRAMVRISWRHHANKRSLSVPNRWLPSECLQKLVLISGASQDPR